MRTGGMHFMKKLMLALALVASGAGMAKADPIELQWWHAMTAVNGDRINKIAADFNASQSDYKVTPVFKGSYAETMPVRSLPTAPAPRPTSSRFSRLARRR